MSLGWRLFYALHCLGCRLQRRITIVGSMPRPVYKKAEKIPPYAGSRLLL